MTGVVRAQRSGGVEDSGGAAESLGAGAGASAASTVSAVDIDPVIHAQARLRIMATLAAVPVGDELHFPRLRELLDMTAGNLSTHLSKRGRATFSRTRPTPGAVLPRTWR